ncbi:MAG: hypothetical protein ABMA01_06455 [Chthoniobacteraceae bacterium]|jgi:hypothetical protein
MNTENNHPHSTRPNPGETENFRPPVTRWNLPAPRLQGVRFVGPVTAVTTVDSPIRPKKTK